MTTRVPNVFPAKSAARRLAVVGESPGADEVAWHLCTRCGYGYSPLKSYSGAKCPSCGGAAVHTPTPFVGPSGLLLNKLLAEVGIEREACFVGNVCQVQPPGNKISLFKWDGPEITSGLEQLRLDLNYWKPHMVLLLGNTPLRAFSMDSSKRNISDWRGSLFIGGLNGGLGVKCMATYHPAALLREPALTAATRFDFKRLRQELAVDGLVLPKREAVIMHPDTGWTVERVWNWVRTVLAEGRPVAFDLEGQCGYVECIGFASDAHTAHVLPFITVGGESVWSEGDECDLWVAVDTLLCSPRVAKIAQNLLFDAFVLAWSYGIIVRPIADDTMLKHHELYCELEKSLAFQTSIYTRQPFYKFQRKHAKVMQEAADD